MINTVVDKKGESKSFTSYLFILISLTVTVGVFWYLFSSVSISVLKQTITGISALGLVSFLVLSIAGSLIRTFRYQLTLSWSGYKVGIARLFLITLVRNLFADLLPARLGTAIYIYLVNSRLGIPVVAATSSFTLALVYDLLSLPPVLAVFILIDPHFSEVSLLKYSVITLAIISIIISFYFSQIISWIQRQEIKFIKLDHKYVIKIQNFLDKLSKELEKGNRAKDIMQLLAYSILVRIAKYGSLIAFLYALVIPLGVTYQDIPPLSAFFGILASEAAASLPVSGIAGFGLYEGTWATVFRLLGLDPEIADITAISHHLLTQVYGYGLGAASFLVLLLLGRMKISEAPSNIKFLPRFVFCSVALALGIYLATHISQAHAENELKRISRNQAEQYFTNNLPKRGGIYYDSNRRGNFGIYYLANGLDKPKKIIADKNYHYMYPTVSNKDGTLAFAKSKTTNRLEPGEVWIRNRGQVKPEILVKGGTFPSFIDDGKAILFEKNRRAVFRISLNNRKTELVFPPKNSEFRKYQIVKPRLSSDGRFLTFTSDRPSAWHIWLVDLKTGQEKLISHGCESSFHPLNSNGVFIKQKDVFGGSGIAMFRIDDLDIDLIVDPKVEFGHEYFPNISPDGRTLYYGSAPNDQHSHLTDNYDLFLLDLESKDAYPKRITEDGYTNRWPVYSEFDVVGEK